MSWLCLTGAVCALYARWLCRHIGGPFRPIRNEVEELGRQAFTALAALLVIVAAGVG